MLKSDEFAAFYSSRHVAVSEAVWHHRLGHSNLRILQHLQASKEIKVNKSRTSPICEPCQMGKSSRLQFSYSSSSVSEPLDCIHSDLWGPSPVTSNQGFRYYVIFVDEHTRYTWFFPLHNKIEFLSVFTAFQNLVENQLDRKIKVFQSDGGGEYINQRFRDHLSHHGIQHRVSCPYTPEQNGLAERKHRHLTELGLSMMFHSHLPLNRWVEAFYTASYIGNFLPGLSKGSKSPAELLLKSKPDYSHLRVFGSACYPYLRPVADHKLEPRSLKCVFLGYSPNYKGYRCLYAPTGKVYISRHVVFDEEYFPFNEDYKHLVPRYESTLLKAWQTATSPPPIPTDERCIRILPPPPDPVTEAPIPPLPPSPIHEADNNYQEMEAPVPQVAPLENTHSMTTRAKSGIQKPNSRYALLVSKFVPEIPKNITEAMKHPGWNGAVGEEMTNIHMLDTWTLVPATPEMNILSSRWVFTVKFNPDGTVKQLKARLVTKGHEQEEGLDYLETFSPVVRTTTIRVIDTECSSSKRLVATAT